MSLENGTPGEGQENTPTEKQYSAVELKAMEMGWRPLEEFDGDEADFVDAKEFVGRAPLFEKIAELKQSNKATNQALEALKEHHIKIAEVAYNKAMKELKAQQTAAIREGDADAFDAIEEKKAAAEAEKQELLEAAEKIKLEQPQIHPELQSWINRNPWYTNQTHMRVFADQMGQRLGAEVRAGSLTQQEALKKIEAAVKEEFPHKFRNPNRDKPGSVESTGKTTPKGGTSVFKMTPEQEKVWRTLERSKVMTKEEYIADLKAMEKE